MNDSRLPRLTVTLLITLLTISSALLAKEDPKMEWGEVPLDQLRMTSYSADTNATAVILFEYGDVSFSETFDLVFKCHRRIKILTKAGYDWGTVALPYYSKDNEQEVKDIEAQTMYLDPSGSVQKQEMKNDAIFTEEIDRNWKRVKFTLPALSPGCIIEYRYTVKSTSAEFLPGWTFQNSEPTLWSEYRAKIPPEFSYAYVSQGTDPFYIHTSDQVRETFRGPAGPVIEPVANSRWAMKDIPALREEPYITTLGDYSDKISFQLTQVNWPGDMPRPILQTWDKVAETLSDLRSFGKQLRESGRSRDAAEAVVATITDSLKKVEAIYDFVRSAIVWNGVNDFTASTDLEDVLEKKSGNAADINLLLTLMLREAGIPAAPVILSTRPHGRIQSVYPILTQFNYVVSRVTVGGVARLLDATDRLRPMNFLPYRALNHTGLLIEGKSCSWVPIEPTARGLSRTAISLTVDSAGAMAGTFEETESEYSALNNRVALARSKPDEFVKSLLNTDRSGFAADSFTIANAESAAAPFIVRAKVSAKTYAQVLGDFIYINPMTVQRLTENPFKLETRNFPVDYAYPLSSTYSFDLAIPDGYVLKDFPKDFSFQLPMKGAIFSRTSQQAGSTYHCDFKIDINQVTIEPKQYQTLKNFYNQMVTHESEQVILVKATSPDRMSK